MDSSRHHTLLAIGLLAGALAAMLPIGLLPVFHPLFKLPDSDLPWLSYGFIRWGWLASLTPILVIICHAFWPRPRQKGLAACWLGCTALLATALLFALAIYLPYISLDRAGV